MNTQSKMNSNTYPGSKSPRVVLAIEHSLDRAAYASALSQQNDIEVAAVVGDSASVFDALYEQSVDLLIADAGLPGLGGARTLAEAAELCPDIGLMLFADQLIVSDVLELVAIRKAGLGLVNRGMFKEIDDFVNAVQVVAGGRVLLEPRVAQLIVAGKSAQPMEILTKSERKVLSTIAEGLSNSATAERLGLKQRTIENYLSSILRKLGERGRPDHDGRVMAILRYLEADGRLQAA